MIHIRNVFTSEGINNYPKYDIQIQDRNNDKPQVNIPLNEKEPHSVVPSVGLRYQSIPDATAISHSLYEVNKVK